MSALKPTPSVEGMEEFWVAARQGRLVLPHCTTCGTYSAPPVYNCWACHAHGDALEWKAVSGDGVVHTFNVYHRAYHPGFADEVPYSTAIIEVDEGPFLSTRVIGCPPEEIVVGMRVHVDFADHNGAGEFRLPMFRPIVP